MLKFDCFIFYNELDLLNLRLHLLYEHIDKFIIVESCYSFQGIKKDYNYEKNISLFERFSDKIIYFKINEHFSKLNDLMLIPFPANEDDVQKNIIYNNLFSNNIPFKKHQFWWLNDYYQRECISRALLTIKPQVDDIIIISDADEIPNPDVISNININNTNHDSYYYMLQHEFCYYLNYYHNSKWVGPVYFLYGKNRFKSINSIRFATKRNEFIDPILIDNGGWHFTSLGKINNIKEKVRNWSHKELNNFLVLYFIKYNVKYGYDIFRRKNFGKLTYVCNESHLLYRIYIEKLSFLDKYYGEKISAENCLIKLFVNIVFNIINKLIRIKNILINL